MISAGHFPLRFHTSRPDPLQQQNSNDPENMSIQAGKGMVELIDIVGIWQSLIAAKFAFQAFFLAALG